MEERYDKTFRTARERTVEKMETITFSELQESGLLGKMETASGRPIHQVDMEITRRRVGAGEFYYRDPDSNELKRVVL
jgi:hypothetical protein